MMGTVVLEIIVNADIKDDVIGCDSTLPPIPVKEMSMPKSKPIMMGDLTIFLI
jgi:hypothetical protein